LGFIGVASLLGDHLTVILVRAESVTARILEKHAQRLERRPVYSGTRFQRHPLANDSVEHPGRNFEARSALVLILKAAAHCSLTMARDL
jgi:hypothetical protein